jgi:hypothetical protein
MLSPRLLAITLFSIFIFLVGIPLGSAQNKDTLRLLPSVKRALTGLNGIRSPYTVDCSYAGGNAAETYPPYKGQAGIIYAHDWVCEGVNRYATLSPKPLEGSAASLTLSKSLLILTHEGIHLSPFSGAKDEILTECRAIQIVYYFARRLGASPVEALAASHDALVAHEELLKEYPHYGSPDCVGGGSLDMHPETPDWPN